MCQYFTVWKGTWKFEAVFLIFFKFFQLKYRGCHFEIFPKKGKQIFFEENQVFTGNIIKPDWPARSTRPPPWWPPSSPRPSAAASCTRRRRRTRSRGRTRPKSSPGSMRSIFIYCGGINVRGDEIFIVVKLSASREFLKERKSGGGGVWSVVRWKICKWSIRLLTNLCGKRHYTVSKFVLPEPRPRPSGPWERATKPSWWLLKVTFWLV